MPVSDEFLEFVTEQMRDFGSVAPRKMFGGAGLYHKNLFFGLVADDVLYLKIDDSNKKDYVQAGSRPFRPYKNKPYTMSYYEVPIDVFEDRQTLTTWAERAFTRRFHE